MIDGDRIVHEVRYAHPVHAVWQALTDPAELAAWLMPSDFGPEPGRRSGSMPARTHWTFAGDFDPVTEIITLDEGRELGWRC